MKQDKFLELLEQRLAENADLADGGVPAWLRPVAFWLAIKPWQSLLLLSFLIVGVWFFGFRQTLLQVVDLVLVI